MDTLAPLIPDSDEDAQRLEDQIAAYTAEGYRVVSRSARGAQLVRPKTFSLGWALVWLLACGVGVLVYIFYWLAKRDDLVYLSLDGPGVGVRAASAVSGRWPCQQCGYRSGDARTTCKRCRVPRP